MRRPFTALLVFGVLVVAGVAGFLYSGLYNVAASEHHWPVTYWVLDTARVRSIKMHAAGISVPDNLNDHARVVAGTAHFKEDCATCHSAPGVEANDLAEGMYPKPPSLKKVAERFTPGELFWILKNGIKMSGMPSWGDHSDDELWNAVAFLEQLPSMTPGQYSELIKASDAAGGMKMR